MANLTHLHWIVCLQYSTIISQFLQPRASASEHGASARQTNRSLSYDPWTLTEQGTGVV